MNQQEKQNYEHKMSLKLHDMEASIEQLKVRVREKPMDIRENFQINIDSLKDSYEELKQSFEKLDKVSGEAWDETRKGMETAWHDLGNGVQRALQKLKGAKN